MPVGGKGAKYQAPARIPMASYLPRTEILHCVQNDRVKGPSNDRCCLNFSPPPTVIQGRQPTIGKPFCRQAKGLLRLTCTPSARRTQTEGFSERPKKLKGHLLWKKRTTALAVIRFFHRREPIYKGFI